MAARSFLYGGAYDGDSGGGGGSVLLTNKRVHCSSSPNPIGSFFIAGSSSSFLGSRSMVSFEDRGNGSGGQFFQSFDHEDNGDDEYDEYFHQPDQKKRRLTADQVRFLEKSFESENKLEPERKLQLAKELGLQPRQVAIWFQNRRARWKTKQLEKDYDELQESYNKLKANYENLLNEKEKLKSEVHELSDKLLLQEKGTSDSSSTKSPSEPPLHQQILDCPYDEDVSRNMNPVNGQNCNFDNGVHTSLLERGDSSYVFEQEPSDGSLDEEVNFSKMFLPPVDGYMSRKFENADYPDPHSVASYYAGLPGDDRAFGFWSY